MLGRRTQSERSKLGLPALNCNELALKRFSSVHVEVFFDFRQSQSAFSLLEHGGGVLLIVPGRDLTFQMGSH